MKRPNILFILTDDQRFDTIRALNCPEIDTPNFDRLVRSGLAFTNETYHGYLQFQRALRSDPFKLIEYHVNGRRRTQLFDLVADPKETRDLVADPAQAEALRDMQARLAQARETFHDHQPEFGERFWKDD